MKPPFTFIRNASGEIESIQTDLSHDALLQHALLNKGTAFTKNEREIFDLQGKLPDRIETLSEQVKRAYQVYSSQPSDYAKNTYLHTLYSTNQTLFYQLVGAYLTEMLPILYTPTVGERVKQCSLDFQQLPGLFLSYQDKDQLKNIIQKQIPKNIELIVATDGESVLGIGDQGIGGMHIVIAKAMVYTLCAGIDPSRILSIQLDVGTNNDTLLQNPNYLGWRHKRISGKDYDDFVDQFVQTIRQHLPDVYLHWEDFGKDNARTLLDRYQPQLCTFNDDMQGTSIVALAAILAGLKQSKQNLLEQQIVILGAGTAGTGIADQICYAMEQAGLSTQAARDRIWLVGRHGLFLENSPGLTAARKVYAKNLSLIENWKISAENISLLDVVKNLHPTILIGCSTLPGAFDETLVKAMAKQVERPIILPLSNPTAKSEATPHDLIHWTNGKAIIATGSPFEPVEYQGRTFNIAQCNNALAYPGLGLGILAAKAPQLSREMILAAIQALTNYAVSGMQNEHSPILPNFENIQAISNEIAKQVANQVAHDEQIENRLRAIKWLAKYYTLDVSQHTGTVE